MVAGLPFDISEAIIQACGSAFWYKGTFRSFLTAAGVPAAAYTKYASESKYVIARCLLSELDAMGDDGRVIQRRLITELCKLRNLPDPNVKNRDAAFKALRELKDLALTQRLYVEEERKAEEQRTRDSQKRQEVLKARADKLEQLRGTFASMVTQPDDQQQRGYELEDLLSELFNTHGIPYRRSYRTQTEQIDGHFKFQEFDYLVEARWRKSYPSEADLAVLKTKVDKKLASTRGLFVSAIGFRPEVVQEFTRGITANIVLMDGRDLTLILEGHFSLMDALDLKVRKAAQEGIIFLSLADIR